MQNSCHRAHATLQASPKSNRDLHTPAKLHVIVMAAMEIGLTLTLIVSGQEPEPELLCLLVPKVSICRVTRKNFNARMIFKQTCIIIMSVFMGALISRVIGAADQRRLTHCRSYVYTSRECQGYSMAMCHDSAR